MSSRMSSARAVLVAPVPAPSLTEAEFLQQIAWERSAPKPLVAAAGRGDVARFATAWRGWLRGALADTRTPSGPLLAGWSVEAGLDPAVIAAIAAFDPPRKRSGKRRPVMTATSAWTKHATTLVDALLAASGAALTTPVGQLAALELLSIGGTQLPAEVWWRLWRGTLSAVQDGNDAVDSSTLSPDVALIVTGELPLFAGLVFAPVAGMTARARGGRRALGRALLAETDTDGTPQSALLSRLPLWLAPLLRSSIWARRFDAPLWTGEQPRRLNDLVERSVALSRADGRLALTNGLPAEPLPMLLAAAELLDWPATHPGRSCLRSMLQYRAAPRSLTKLRKPAVQVMPSNQSDWARLVLLRSDWTAAAASVAVAHHQPLPELDVTIHGQPVLHGSWGLELQLGDAAVELADEWSCVCWESDPDADYAELQMTGPGRLRVERQVLLSRKDQFLLLADVISGAPAGRLTYRSRLPFAPAVQGDSVPGRREFRLTAARAKVRVFPLALPEDVTLSTPHRCQIDGHGLTLEQIAEGRGLMAPLVFDWHPQRRNAEALWRRLTVTENGKVLPGDAAAAFRWKVGRDQWLCYRGLKPAAVPRAVLGCHTPNETLIGRFDTKGEVDPILMIEP
jgi:hypothetical protein